MRPMVSLLEQDLPTVIRIPLIWYELIIVHSEVPDRAEQLKQMLTEYVAEEKISITELGAGLGVHGGPGVLLAAIRKPGNQE